MPFPQPQRASRHVYWGQRGQRLSDRALCSPLEVQECWWWKCLSSASWKAGSAHVKILHLSPTLANLLQNHTIVSFLLFSLGAFFSLPLTSDSASLVCPQSQLFGALQAHMLWGPVISCPSAHHQLLSHPLCGSQRHEQPMSSPGVVVSWMKPGNEYYQAERRWGEAQGLMKAEQSVAEQDRARLCKRTIKISSFSPS